MTDIKTQVQGINPNVQARDVKALAEMTHNIYETINVIAKRANQLSNDLKVELHDKLEEFASHSDTIEEVHENKEQIEISKFYEKLPNPVLIAIDEFLQGRKILLGVTGSIAAYKSLLLLRLLTKAGAEVQVILTKNAHDFVGELSFSTLSNKPVYTDLKNDHEWQNHVELGLWADLILI